MTAAARVPDVTLNALQRTILRPRAPADDVQRCQLCSAPVLDRHRHMLDEQSGNLLCACQACALLFQRDAAGRDHYRLVPDRRVRLPGVPVKDLGVPVGLGFFVSQPDGAVIANYPSPMGPTQWDVDPLVWQRVQCRCPAVTELEPAVEAVLVNTARGFDEHWIVPIDDCYRLVAVIRQEWRGLSGGGTVWPAIERFFTELGGNRTSRSE